MRDALSAAERLQDSARIALSSSGIARILCLLGRAVEALPYGRRAVEAATILNERRSTIRAHMVLGAAHWLLGHYRQATDHLEKNRELTKSDIRRGAALPFSFMVDCATSRAWQALNLVELGEFDAAIRVADEAVELTESAQHHHLLARFAVSWVHLRRGEGGASSRSWNKGWLGAER